MKKPMAILLFGILLSQISLSNSTQPLAKDTHHSHGGPSLSLDNGKKWSTDSILKDNMEVIRDHLRKVQSLHTSGKATKTDYAGLSKTLKESTGNIVKKCKLEPKTDAQFHVILADLLLSAEELKKEDTIKTAMDRLDSALNAYGQHFEHPNWK